MDSSAENPRYELSQPSFIGLLKGAFDLYREHFWVFLGIAAFIHIPLVILESLPWFVSEEAWPSEIWSMLPHLAVLHLAFAVESAALTAVVANAYLGRRVTVRAGYARVRQLLGPILVASVISGIGISVGLMLLVLPGILLMLRWMFYVEVLVVEGEAMSRSTALTHGVRMRQFRLVVGAKAAEESLSRSAVLTRLVRGRLFGLWIVLGSLSYSAGALLSWTLPVVEQAPVIGGALRGLFAMLVSPLSNAAFVLAYFDARVRYDRFDLPKLAAEVPAER